MKNIVLNLKRNDTNEFTYKTNRDSQTQRMKLCLLGGKDIQEVWAGHEHTAIFKMNNQQGPTVQHMEPCSMLCGSLDGKCWGRMHMCICMAESLRLKYRNIVNQLYPNTK